MVKPKDKINIRLEKVKDDIVPVSSSCSDIDVELAIAINNCLRSKMKQRRLTSFKMNNVTCIAEYKNAIVEYQKRCCVACKPKDVLISVFRISEDYLQENYIVDNEIKTTYYKIIRW